MSAYAAHQFVMRENCNSWKDTRIVIISIPQRG